jgi:hypothetical protein
MEKIYKTLLIVLFFAAVIISGIFLIMYISSMDLGGTLYLSEIDAVNASKMQVVNLTDDDFSRYPQLRKLFENADPDKSGFISTAGVSGRVIYELKSRYSAEADKNNSSKYIHKALYWNNSYYKILVSMS